MDEKTLENLIPILIPKEALALSGLNPGTPVSFFATKGKILIEEITEEESETAEQKESEEVG